VYSMRKQQLSTLQIAEELKRIDVTTYTPIEALNVLFELSKRAKGE